jgi:hypothetical protein
VVICTTRDPDAWWKSMEAVKNKVFAMRALNALFQLMPTVRYFGAWVDAMTAK